MRSRSASAEDQWTICQTRNICSATARCRQTLQLLIQVLEDAVQELQIMKVANIVRDETEVRSQLSRRILMAASARERDPSRHKAAGP